MSKMEENLVVYNDDGLYDERLASATFNSDLAFKNLNYEPSTGMPNSQRALTQALAEGLDVVFPQTDELQIDIDNEHSRRLFENQLMILKRFVGVLGTISTPSKSGKPHKYHITVKLDVKLSVPTRLGLQAMLGSDRVRELLSYVQYINGDQHPTLFLEKKNTPKQLTGGTE